LPRRSFGRWSGRVAPFPLLNSQAIHHEKSRAAGPQPKQSAYISRKDAKAAKKKKKYLSELGVLRALAGKIRVRDVSYIEKFAQAAKTFKPNSTQSSQRSEYCLINNFLLSVLRASAVKCPNLLRHGTPQVDDAIKFLPTPKTF
jgi:hypothetical protein